MLVSETTCSSWASATLFYSATHAISLHPLDLRPPDLLSHAINHRTCFHPSVKSRYLVSHSSSTDSVRPPWTVAPQAPPSAGLSRREYWSGYLFPSPGGLPDSEIETESVVSPALAGNTIFPESSCFGIILETLGRKLSKAGCQSTGREHTHSQSCGLAPSGPLHMLPSSPKIPCGVPSLRKSVAERTPSPGSLPYPLPSAANLHFNLLLTGLFTLVLAQGKSAHI